MTAVIDPPEAEAPADATVTESAKRGRERDRDFTKYNSRHEALAKFINENSGLDPITPNVVKAVQLLADDFRNTDEAKAEREAVKAARAEAEKQYAGLSDEEKKELRSADRKLKSLAEIAARRDEILAKAAEATAESDGQVSSDAEAEAEAASGEQEPGKRRIGARAGRK